MRKMMMTLGAAALVIGGIVGLATVTASAGTTSSSTYQVSVGNANGTGTVIGTATVSNDSSAGTISVSFLLNSGVTLQGGYICLADNSASTNAPYITQGTGFTARVNPGSGADGCPAGYTGVLLQHFGTTVPWRFTGIPATYFADGMYLQIHLDVNGGTAYACWHQANPPATAFYGSCNDPGSSSPVPVGTVGGLGAAVLAGGGLVFIQRRRGHALRSTKAQA